MSENLGRTLGGRYEICDRIGAGGVGTVYRARDRVLDRVVALKLLRPGQDATARARLRAEARVAARLSHPSIASVLDYGEDVVDGEPWPYLVMEYVEGTTLRDVLRQGPMTPAHVAELVAQVAEALGAAHAAGVVHRDVKPSNIMRTADRGAVLLDFGIARHADDEPLTLTGNIVGTVDYISPEQAAGRRATTRSDLFALGMVAHEALTGRRALTRETQMATLLAHATQDVGPLPEDVPAPLRALIDQLVRRDPSERPADAASVVRRARDATSAEPVTPAPVPLPAAGGGRPRRRDRRQRRLLLAVGVAALVLAGLGTVLSRGTGDTPRATPAHGTAAAARHRPGGIGVLDTTGQDSAPVAAADPDPAPTVTQVAAAPAPPVRAHAGPAARHRGGAHAATARGEGKSHGKAHRHGHGAGGNGHRPGHHKKH